jgi:endogenous inhibitor of DNA gyrase (YacG/DUF329 family)
MTGTTIKKCPICSRPAVEAHKPFCSKRCTDIDLNRWLSGTYVIPARDDEPMSEFDGDADREE